MSTRREKDNSIIICRCEEITQRAIEDAIREGADTIDSVKRRTRAGMGLCQGKTCRQLVAKILRDKMNKSLKEIFPATFRPPFRPIKLGVVAKEGEKFLKKDKKGV